MRHNRESSGRQYAPGGGARELVWHGVVVVDDGLGQSGDRTKRPGYDRLLATVRRSELGMVLSLKAYRLAPNGRKWHIGHLNPRGTATLDQRP